MHLLPAWQASTKGLKAKTIVPNPLGISPQTHVPCGWRRVLMHKHYNMFMHLYFLCFVTLIGCVLFVIIPAWVENCACLLFYFECFYIIIFFFYQSFLAFVSKIQKHIKSRKSKNFDRHYCVLSQACTALYLCTNGFVHLWA